MRRASVNIAAISLAAGLLAALIPAGPAFAAGPGHKVLLRNGQYAYTTQTPARPSPRTRAPFRPKLIRNGQLQARPASITPDASRGSISGRVTGDGHPLRGICVTVTYPGNGTFVTTSKSGRYRLTDLRPGRYYVAFIAVARQCPNQGNWLLQWYRLDNTYYPSPKATEVRVRADHDTPGINAELKHGARITGVVRNASGKALGGICAAVSAFFGQSEQARTNAQGRYTIRGLYPNEYIVVFYLGCGSKGNYEPEWWPGSSAKHAKTIKVLGRRLTAGIDATMRPGALIAGTVRTENAGLRPLGGVCLDTFSDSGSSFIGGPPGPFAITPKDGRFVLKGLAKGRYDLQIDPTCNQRKASLYRATDRTLKVKAGQIRRGVRVLLRPAAGASGRVTDSRGRPLKGICVDVLGDGGKTKTGADGRYKILGIHPAKYPVSFDGGCGNTESVIGQYYKDKPGYQSATRIDFKSGKVATGISAVMQPGATGRRHGHRQVRAPARRYLRPPDPAAGLRHSSISSLRPFTLHQRAPGTTGSRT